jgi:DNA end-binding protein Ku
MAAHASWKGFLKLSLVSVPVKAYTATASSSDITLHQLHAKTLTRIQYKKFAPEVGEVSSEEIVKGYEYDKGQYVIIEEDEIDKLRTESDKSIRIDGFVTPDAVSSIYLGGRTYYLTPDGPVGQKPYNLLMKSMQTNGVGAIAEVVISQKEQVVLVRPIDGLLAMTVLNRKDEVKAASSFKDEVSDTPLTEAEISLTDTLIKASMIKNFDFGRYRDVYKEKLTKLIQMKIEGKEVVQVRDPEEPKIINLMEALKRSVAEAQAAGGETGAGETAKGGRAGGSEKKAAKADLKQAPSVKAGKGTAASSAAGTAASTTVKKRKVV